MKYNTLNLLLGSILLLFMQNSYAQEENHAPVWSLEEIWKTAEANNRQLQLADLNLQQSALEILEAKDRLLPELSIGGDAKLNTKFLLYPNGLLSSPQNVPVKAYGYAAGYNLNFNLYNGGKDRRNIQMKEEEAVRQQYEAALQKHNVKYRIALAYFDLYRFLHFRDVLATEIAAEEKQVTLVESLYQHGVVLKSDVLRISVKLAQLGLSLSDIQKKITLTSQRLNILMGRVEDAELTINYQGRFETEAHQDYADYLAIAIDQSPAYKMVQSDMKWSALNSKQVKAMRLPKVSLYSNYNYTYPQISFYPYTNNLWGFGQTGVKVQFSVDNLYKSKHAIARAEVLINQAKEKADIKKDELSMQVKEAYLQEQQALESVETATKNSLKTAEVVRVIRNSYLNQESLLTDLLEAENAFLEAKFNLTSAEAEVKISHIRLLAILGIL